LESGGHFIQINKAGGNARYHALVGVPMLDLIDALMDQGLYLGLFFLWNR